MTNNDDYQNYVGGGELDDNGADDDKGEPPMDLYLILGKNCIFCCFSYLG